MIRREKGVTLVSLVVMVIIIMILATVATYTGISTYNDMKVTEFKKRMEVVSEKVESLRKRAEVDSELRKKLGLDEENESDVYGKEVPNDVASKLSINDGTGFRYFSNDDMNKQLKLNNIEGSYVINFGNGIVYSVEGVKFDNKMIYSVDEIN